MKTLKLILLTLAVSILGFSQANTLSTTTLSAAMTNNQTFVSLASTTNVVAQSFNGAGSFLYVDRELMPVIAITPVGTTGTQNMVTVTRGVSGTLATAHQSGALVFIGPGYAYSGAAVGDGTPAGSCTLSAQDWYPRVHVLTGAFYTCPQSTQWGYGGPSGFTPGLTNSITAITGTYTAKYWDSIIQANSGSFTLTLPAAAAMPGKVFFLTNPGSGTVTVTTAAGCATIAQNAACRVYSTGSVWQLF